jgi:hypothetical protein
MLIVLLAALYLIKLQAPIDVITPENNYRKTVNNVYENLELYTFLDSLAIPESGNIDHYPIIYKGKKVESPYHIVNGIGAAGRWQMMPCARRDVGYKGTLKEFLSSPDIQRKCIIKFMKKNKKYMDYYIPNYRDYIGKEIITHRKVFTKRIIQGKDTIYKKCIIRADTAVITFSGLIGTMHLTGVGGLKRLLYNKINSTDGNATAMQYMKRFKDFKISNMLNSEDIEKRVLMVYEENDINEEITHKNLCLIAAKYLKNQGIHPFHRCKYVVCELEREGESPDAFGWGGTSTQLIEVKISRSDFLSDKNKRWRKLPEIGLAAWRSYLCPKNIIKPKDLPNNWGLLYFDKGKVEIIKSPSYQDHNKSEELHLVTNIMRREGIKSQIFSYKQYKVV